MSDRLSPKKGMLLTGGCLAGLEWTWLGARLRNASNQDGVCRTVFRWWLWFGSGWLSTAIGYRYIDNGCSSRGESHC